MKITFESFIFFRDSNQITREEEKQIEIRIECEYRGLKKTVVRIFPDITRTRGERGLMKRSVDALFYEMREAVEEEFLKNFERGENVA